MSGEDLFSKEENVGDTTPTEKLNHDPSVLKNLASAEGMDPVQKQALNEKIDEISQALLQSFSDQTKLSELKENYDLFKKLSDKGFEAGDKALERMGNEIELKGLSFYDVINRNLNNEKQEEQSPLKQLLSRQSNYGKGPNKNDLSKGNAVTQADSETIQAPSVPQEQTVADLTEAVKKETSNNQENVEITNEKEQNNDWLQLLKKNQPVR